MIMVSGCGSACVGRGPSTGLGNSSNLVASVVKASDIRQPTLTLSTTTMPLQENKNALNSPIIAQKSLFGSRKKNILREKNLNLGALSNKSAPKAKFLGNTSLSHRS